MSLARLPLLVCLLLLPLPLRAADDKKAVTSIAEADADFAVQGEYVGHVAGVGNVGLQVVALGEGKFDGVLYHGGLPGAGWNGTTKAKLTSQRHVDVIELVNESHLIALRGSFANVYDAKNSAFVGSLRKIHRTSPTMNLPPPAGATLLFTNGKVGELKDAKVSPDGLLEIGATTAMPVDDFRLHLEFKTPYQPAARGQGRGNSGVYIQRRYEVQILDSFGLDGVANECGALYRQTPPTVNMALPPLAWQTYDIWFTAAKFDSDGKKIAPALITVLHNGVPVHDKHAIANKTGAGQAEGEKPLPIHFQNHGNPVQFRNVWIVLGPPTHPADAPPPIMAAACECRCVPTCCAPRRPLLGRIFRRCR